jgi:prolycopene isomerase
MNLMNGTVVRDRYDVIVVGAGLGGMTAASLLANRGLSVLMVEQQNKPGGACTSFKREDHVFDVGAAMLYGFGEKGFRPFRFVLNELEEPIDVVAHKTLARMTFEGHEIVFWPDIDRFLEELYALFPQEKDGLKAFYNDLYKMYENIVLKNEVVSPPSEFSARQGLRRLLSGPIAMLTMPKLLSISVNDLMKKYFKSAEIVDFFDKLCSAYSYTTAEETPAVMAATMFIDNHVGGVYYPAGGAQMLPNTLEKAFERNGGQVLYQQMVDEILIRDGKAYGVRLQNGLEILGERVIANATVWNIYGKLVRSEHIPPERLEWVRSLIPTYPSMTLYMVLDRPGFPENVFPWEIYIENRKVIDSSDLTLYVNSLVDASLCPPDDLVVMAISPNLCSWPSPDEPAYRSETYEAQKQQEAEKMLEQIEMHIPGFRQRIRKLIIGTPSTIERYLLKNGGAVGGPKNQIGQEMLKRLHARSEWKNLYFCGDSTVMGTGAPATVVSGVGAANVILRELRLPEYDSRKHPRQYVHLVEQPYRRPAYSPDDLLSELNAYLAAADCQGCQEPACVSDCPASIDIPGFMRRMEVKNYEGAARLIRERNPFGEVCGLLCAADQLCQRSCYRRDFTGKPVRIAELQRWVCAQAGESGWPKVEFPVSGPKVAVIGNGPAALSCAYYLCLTGCRVTVFSEEERPVVKLWEKAVTTPALQAALQNDLKGLMSAGIDYQVLPEASGDQHLSALQDQYRAVFLSEPGNDGQDSNNLSPGRPGVFIGKAVRANGYSVVEAAAQGREAAVQIWQYLNAVV